MKVTQPAEHYRNVDLFWFSICNLPDDAAKPWENSEIPTTSNLRALSTKAIFTVDSQKLLGVVQQLSLTGGSALLFRGPIAEGT